MDLHPDLIDLLTEFENSGVEYLIVGGWAIGIHSEPRFTKDLDLMIGPSAENLLRVVEALDRFGAPKPLLNEVRTMTADEFVFFGVPPARVDLLRSIPGVDFGEAWTRRLDLRWNEVNVHVIGLEDLRAAKRAAGREQDLRDLKKLEAFERRRK